MSTILDIVNGALKRIRVIASDETANNVDAADALSALNDMMTAFDMEGADTQWTARALTDNFPLNARHEGGVKALLAVRLAEDFGKPIGAVLARDADQGKSSLQNDYSIIENMTIDQDLLNMPSQRRHART